jgi:Xaa-Pro aminopeptidase
MNADARVTALRRRIAAEEIEAALITRVENIVYLTGFEGVFDEMVRAALVVTAEFARVYVDPRYVEAVQGEAVGTTWDVRLEKESIFTELCRDLADDGISTLAMESSMPHARFLLVSGKFEGRVVAQDGWVEELRQVKEAVEVDACERAAALTDAAFDHILGVISPGMREIDVSLALEVHMRMNGSEGLAFSPIVASGPNSSKPHAGVTTRVIERGDLLTLDFGARVRGYCADFTRTLVVGQASDEQRRIYDAVLAANLAGIEAVAPGVKAADVDRAARDLLGGRGLAEQFGHGLGHGVGLAIHELPSLGSRSTDVLQAGCVVTVEPGVYVPGFGGVRIEDLLAVVEGGSRLLSHGPKALVELK